MVRTRREIAKLRLKMDAAEATIRTMRLVQKRGDVDGSVCGRRSWARELDEELRRGCGRYEGSEVFDLVMGEGRLEIWYEVRMDQQCRFQALQKDIQIQRAQECCTIASVRDFGYEFFFFLELCAYLGGAFRSRKRRQL